MQTTRTSEAIDQDRRRLLGTAAVGIAAAGAASLLPTQMAAATTDDAIRPFDRQLPRGRPHRASPAHRRHAMAGARARIRRGFPADLVDPGDDGANARRATRHHAEAHAVLGNGIRLEQVRGAVEGTAEFRHRDRRRRHPFHPREVRSIRVPCPSSSRMAGPVRSSSS